MQNRKGSILEVVISDGQGDLSLTFFNQAWRVKDLRPGRRGIFAGKVGEYRGAKQLAHPDYELFDDEETARTDGRGEREPADPHLSRRRARSRAGSSRRSSSSCSTGSAPCPTRSPRACARGTACSTRAPRSSGSTAPTSRTRSSRPARRCACTRRSCCRSRCCSSAQFVRALSATTPGRRARCSSGSTPSLPFARTPDQVAVGDQIAHDLEGDWPMNRLVQGEVGSGKTLVALRAMLQVAESGGQSALIAPTEVLAGQHVRSIARMLGPAARARAHAHAAHRSAARGRAAQSRAAHRLRPGAHRRRHPRAAQRDDDVRRPRPRRRRRAAPLRRRAARIAAREGLVAARAGADRDARSRAPSR